MTQRFTDLIKDNWIKAIALLISAIFTAGITYQSANGKASTLEDRTKKLEDRATILEQHDEQTGKDIATLIKGQNDMAQEVHTIYSKLIRVP
jgi:hypothetical protein